MSSCSFISVLNKLRKSSKDSIDNTAEFDGFKQYMHVGRNVEEDLKELLRKVNKTDKKSLILLCGSAGDGKSHILSYLKNYYDEEKLIKGYDVINDATESESPQETSIERLDKRLSDFKDNNLNKKGKNTIIGINLGVLNNFIKSEFGKEYTELKKFIDRMNRASNEFVKNEFEEDSFFQYINFSDYHMYKLGEEGVNAQYILKIFDKIFAKSSQNSFFYEYKNSCDKCKIASKCPIKHNFEFLMDESVRKTISNLLVKTTVVDKVILTTREVLDFIYNIIVAQDFDAKKIIDLDTDKNSFIKEYLKQITPSLIFSSKDVTNLMTIVSEYDPLLERSKEEDSNALNYYLTDDVEKYILDSFGSSSYAGIICQKEIISRINTIIELKQLMYDSLVRIDFLYNKFCYDDSIYDMYLRTVYYYNTGQIKKLRGFFALVKNGVEQWSGKAEDKLISVKNSKDLRIYEKINMNLDLKNIPQESDEKELDRFLPYVISEYKFGDKTVSLKVYYSLFELLNKLNRGYIQTVEDRNNHADFIGFIKEIVNRSESDELIIKRKEDGKKISLVDTEIGIEFKVV